MQFWPSLFVLTPLSKTDCYLLVQATLAVPPPAVESMMKGIYFAYVVVTLAYFPVATAGYAAYGNDVNADVLLSVSRPAGLIAVANFMVVIHIAASYQVSAMQH